MRLLFVADGRSPTALNWIEYFLLHGHEVHLASTFSSDPDERLASYHLVPVAFSSLKPAASGSAGKRNVGQSLLKRSAVHLRTKARQWLGPLTLPQAAHRLCALVNQIKPDLVHAMRIPYEGMLAALADPAAPLLISVWGNDFTLHASSTPLMAYYTRLALRRADALHTDCHRDARLAGEWGFAAGKPVAVLPGAGGIQPELFHPPTPLTGAIERAERERTVINPRGIRAYVRNDTFFQAVPLVLEQLPNTRFLCPTMAGEPQAERWLDELGLHENVNLLPRQTRPQMAALFQDARVVVSPSTHDGTPNTLLEAMACGCLPVAGDIESLREWITHGVNGLLVDPGDPQSLAQGILTAMEDRVLADRAREHNLRLIAERATYGRVMEQAQGFYRQFC